VTGQERAVIQGIVWDLDETLIVEESAVVASFTSAAELAAARAGVPAAELGVAARRCARARWRSSPAREFCVQVGIASWEGLWCAFAGDEEPIRRLREWAPEYRVGTWADALAEYGVTDADLPEAMAAAFVAARRNTYQPYPDALDALTALRGSLPMAVLTNGARCLQREKLDGAGLAGWFDFVLVSGDIGIGKPDPRVFAACAERLGLEPGGLLMIGDSLDRDIVGAHGAGFQALWVDRLGAGARPPGPGAGVPPKGVARVGSLRDLDLPALREGRLITAR
jgi:putative hydrolase of the HAD superfamily